MKTVTTSDTSGLVLVALGSNQGDSPALIRAAMDRIEQLAGRPVQRSSLWHSTPVDCPPGSPGFLNAALAFSVPAEIAPELWLGWTQALEREFGRTPKRVLNEPRPLDVDLIAWGGEVRDSAELVLPHPRAGGRRFVLAPLAELVPEFRLPGQAHTVAELLEQCAPDPQLQRWNAESLSRPALASRHPLGRNQGRYQGETVDIVRILAETRWLAAAKGWQEERLLAGSERELVCLTRPHRTSLSGRALRLYVSAGIHGDEPAGPAALLEIFRKDLWPDAADLWVCPCLNPTGCARTTRENDVGVDLNRDYRRPVTVEVRAHQAWLDRQPEFDGVVCLHEDWESKGFYCYELDPSGRSGLAEAVIASVQKVCPIEDAAVIDGRPATGPGVIRPSVDPASRPLWPEAFHLWQRRRGHSLTLESPSDFPLEVRVDALVAGVTGALEHLMREGNASRESAPRR